MASQDVVDYIREQMDSGFTAEQITRALISEGWGEEEIREGFDVASEIAHSKLEKPLSKPLQDGEKPSAGFIISLIGGILVLFNGISFMALPSLVAEINSILPTDIAGDIIINALDFFQLRGVLGLLFGALIVVGSIAVYKNKRTAGGLIVIGLSIVSLVTVNGFLIGSVLGIIGGVLSIKR